MLSLRFHLFLLQVAMVGGYAYRVLRDRRPYQLVLLLGWALCLFTNCTDRTMEFAPVILAAFVGGVVLKRRDKLVLRRAVERWLRDFTPPAPAKKPQPPEADRRGLYDLEIDGPQSGRRERS